MEDCKVTWEKETAIPKSILEEYATDALVDIQKLITRSMGHTAHTLSVNTRGKNPEPDSKKQKSDRITVQCDSGYVIKLCAFLNICMYAIYVCYVSQ